jgi:hypothetical protein
MSRIVNLVLFQLGWCACVFGAAWNLQGLGVGIGLGLLGMHLWLARDRSLQVKLAISTAGIGLVLDSAQMAAGIFTFPRGLIVVGLPPPFMTVLWLLFATTFRYGMRWLSGRYSFSALFGLLGSPISFLAGERLEAIEFPPPVLLHYAGVGLVWAGVVPLLIWISDRLAFQDGGESEYRWFATLHPER